MGARGNGNKPLEIGGYGIQRGIAAHLYSEGLRLSTKTVSGALTVSSCFVIG